MKNFIFIIVLIISCCSHKYAFGEHSSNDNLTLDSTKVLSILKPQHIDFKSNQRIPSYFVGFTMTNSVDSLNIIKITLSKKYNLELYTYEYVPNDFEKYHSEYLEYNGEHIYIDSLLNQSHNTLIEKNPYVSITEMSDFEFNGDNFILLTCENRNFYRNGTIRSYILIQLNNGQILGSWMFYNAYEDKNVFADYDRDGQLDYLSWRLNDDTINIYKLNGKSFIKDETHYIKLKYDKKAIDSELDWLYKINYKKSKWFFNLK